MTPIKHPTGYPYLLFVNENTVPPYFFLAKDHNEASKSSPNGVAYVMVVDLISNCGHKETHNFLKTFGNEWMTSDGMAFFKSKPI